MDSDYPSNVRQTMYCAWRTHEKLEGLVGGRGGGESDLRRLALLCNMMDVVSARLRFSPPEELGTFLGEGAEGERLDGDDVGDSGNDGDDDDTDDFVDEDDDSDKDNSDDDCDDEEERVPATWKQICTAAVAGTCSPALCVDPDAPPPDDLLVEPCCEPPLADVYSTQSPHHCGESLNGVLIYTVEVLADKAEGKDNDEEDRRR